MLQSPSFRLPEMLYIVYILLIIYLQFLNTLSLTDYRAYSGSMRVNDKMERPWKQGSWAQKVKIFGVPPEIQTGKLHKVSSIIA
jgi:hypothetical protein